MKRLKSFLLVGISLALWSTSAILACDTCGGNSYGGLYQSMGYGGYGFGTSMYDIGSSFGGSSSGGGGCGSYYSSCGSSSPSINIDIDINIGSGSSCGGGCGGGYGSFGSPGYGGGGMGNWGSSLGGSYASSGLGNYGGLSSYGISPFGMGGLGGYSSSLAGYSGFGGVGSYAGGPFTGNLFANNPYLSNPLMNYPSTYNGLGTLNNPVSQYYGSGYTGTTMYTTDPITGQVIPINANYPNIGIPGVTSYIPGVSSPFYPRAIPDGLYPIGYPTAGTYPTNIGTPINSVYPYYPDYANYPRTTYPGGVAIPAPPTGSLPWGGCDNVTVICPGTGANSSIPGTLTNTPGSIIPIGTTTPTTTTGITPIGTTPAAPVYSTTHNLMPVAPSTVFYPRAFSTK